MRTTHFAPLLSLCCRKTLLSKLWFSLNCNHEQNKEVEGQFQFRWCSSASQPPLPASAKSEPLLVHHAWLHLAEVEANFALIVLAAVL